MNSADEPFDDALIEVVAAQVGVAIGRFDFDHAFADFEDGDIECAAAKVVDGDGLVLLFVEAVGQRGRSGLVDDALDVEAGDFARVLGGLALRVVEVGRNGDHGLSDGLAEVGFGGLLELLQDHGGDLGRGVLLALGDDPDVVALLDHLEGDHLHLIVDLVVAAAHEALDGEDGVLGVGDGLALGHLADQPLAALGEGDDRGGGARTLLIRNDFWFAAFHDSDARVGGTEVDSNHFSHVCVPAFGVNLDGQDLRLSVLLSTYMMRFSSLGMQLWDEFLGWVGIRVRCARRKRSGLRA